VFFKRVETAVIVEDYICIEDEYLVVVAVEYGHFNFFKARLKKLGSYRESNPEEIQPIGPGNLPTCRSDLKLVCARNWPDFTRSRLSAAIRFWSHRERESFT